jgi:hypothetical protein
MKTINYYIGFWVLLLLAVMSCKEDSIIDNPSGETIIYNLRIINGDLSGGARYDGVVDEENKTITFSNIAAETDIAQVKFSGKISLGAKLDKEAYDFFTGQTNPNASNLNGEIVVTNGENIANYKVILNLLEPEAKPMVNKLEVTTASGRTVSATIDLIEKMIYLNTPNEDEVTLKSLTLMPARTAYSFTKLSNNKLAKSDPGYIQLDFLGNTDDYRIFFDNAPAAGIDFSQPIIHDLSLRAGLLYPDFVAELTRSADFDGEHILIVSREGGIYPKLLKARDVLNNTTPTPIMLSTAEITGGTYVISSGRLAQGHIYICNLSTGLADTDAGKLKLYHYATPTSNPELILDFNGIINETTKSTGRFGDNLSLDLDEEGNGYAYFVHQTSNEILRFTITGFTTVGEPTLIVPSMPATYYACYNKVGDANEYLYTSTVASVAKLLDKDGKDLAEIEKTGSAIHGTDAHIINYNSGRYLIMTSGRQQSAWGFPTLFVYDMTEGFNTVAAMVNFNQKTPDPVFSYQMGESAASGGCSGIAAWAAVDGKLCVFAAAPRSGFVLIEFPKNQR